jgi:chemotaxis protein methyltransferase CheR
MTPQDYDYIRKLLRERSGLVLSADKQYLVESRLVPVARKQGLASLTELVATLKSMPLSPLTNTVVEAMTTNESFFFRDKQPLVHFRDVIIPALMAARAQEKHIRIWCAAAATGQEPYSLAMILRDIGIALKQWRVEILATDICSPALEKAKVGLYSQFEVQRGLSIQMLIKYFIQAGEVWQISSDIRSMVTYRHFNLLQDFSSFGTFDVVFCRNVLIYFDQATKTSVLNRISRSMRPDGYLLLGAAETVVGLTDAFKPLPQHRGLYMPASAPTSAKALNLAAAS